MKADVAIIGMAGLFPKAPNVRVFWENILGKVDAIDEAPDWSPEFGCDPETRENDVVTSRRGGYLGDIVQFDPLAYGVMPRSVDGGEPEHFVALQLAYEALADAGYAERPFARERTGVILGRGTYVNRGVVGVLQRVVVVNQTLRLLRQLHPEWSDEELATLKRKLTETLPPFNAETAPGLASSTMCGRIANRLDLMGPSYAIDAACASSLIAVDLAAKELRSGTCDLMLAGGIQVSTNFPIVLLFSQLGALSRSGQLRSFHPEADGTLLGEGAGILVLKRWEDARRDGDRIYAVVRSVGIASDGRAVGVLAPRVEGEVLAMQRAYEAAGLSPATVTLVEAHGTGTAAGDATEIEALHRVFGPCRGALPTVALGSVKSMVGHSIPAAGAAGLIKAALALHHKVLPPTLHADVAPPKLADGPFYLNGETQPWVHGGDSPRRAAVSAFGFGGIDAHAVLEEVPDAPVPAPLARWEAEVFVVRAASRGQLLERLAGLHRFVAANPTALPGELACTLASCEGAHVLAVVATDLAELDRKLAHAIERLTDARCVRIKDRSGIYFFAEPLARTGTLAFLFPGEGAQYPGMLHDLALHFPVVRGWFDLMDRALRGQARGHLPSQLLFGPAAGDAERLWEMDGAVATVFASNQALHALVVSLGLTPAAVVGHSSGEYSALLAAGATAVTTEPALVEHVRAIDRVAGEAARDGLVAPAALLAVGTPNRALITAAVAESDGAVHLAMDNCPHQAVLGGTEAAIERTLDRLRTGGALCQRLPFARAYHTPLFAAFADALRRFFDTVPFVAPSVPLYSCVTAAPVAPEPDEIRRLAIEQWTRPVRFRETVEGMYAAGVRLFLEVGPRGNLTAFVDDILGKRPHLALAANVQRRSGLVHLQHVVGLLAAHGVAFSHAALYAPRGLRALDLDAVWAGATLAVPAGRGRPLRRDLPVLELDDGAALRPALARRVDTTPPVAGLAVSPAALAASPFGVGLSAARSPVTATVMATYLQTMDDFLRTQEDVMRAFLAPGEVALSTAVNGALPTPEAAISGATDMPERPVVRDQASLLALLVELVSERTGYPRDMVGPFLNLEGDLGIDSIKRIEILGALEARLGYLSVDLEQVTKLRTLAEIAAMLARNGSPPAHPHWPLAGTIVRREASGGLVSRTRLDLDAHPFLRDHTLGGRVAPDDALTALPVLPLTMTLEIAAEAAAATTPGRRVVALREVRAGRWLCFETGHLTLETTAEPRDADTVHVRVHCVDDTGTVEPGPAALEAWVELATTFPAAPAPAALTLDDERPLRWRPDDLYAEGMTHGMFHGPSLRGVRAVDRVGENGAEGTLRALPLSGILRDDPAPRFALDPILLDAAGQVLGFWNADRLAESVVVFPVALETLEVFAPPLAPQKEARCQVRIREVAAHRILADLEIVGSGDRLLARLTGWEVRRVHLPPRHYAFRLAPREERLASPLAVPEGLDIEACRLELPPGFGEGDGAVWREAMAHLVLSARERAEWRVLGGPEQRRTGWLAGRVAVKDAVRTLLARRHGLRLYPTEVEITADEHGRPVASGTWEADLGAAPAVSLAHTDGIAVAVAGDHGVGIDVERLGRVSADVARLAFGNDERAVLATIAAARREDWETRAWCAKEAIGKALGRGLVGGPGDVLVRNVDQLTGAVEVTLAGALTGEMPHLADRSFVVHTACDGDAVVALAVLVP